MYSSEKLEYYSIINLYLGKMMISVEKLKSNYKNNVVEEFDDFIIQIPKSLNNTSLAQIYSCKLQNLINSLFEYEYVDIVIDNKKETLIKKKIIFKYPTYLNIMLNRFENNDSIKNTLSIEIPINLNLINQKI